MKAGWDHLHELVPNHSDLALVQSEARKNLLRELPSRKQEDWRYAPTSFIDSFDPKAKQGSQSRGEFLENAIWIIFEDGIYNHKETERNLPQGLRVEPIAQVSGDGARLLNKWIHEIKNANRSDSNFSKTMLLSYLAQGALITVSKNTILDKPIQIIRRTTLLGSAAQVSDFFLNVESGAQVSLYEHMLSSEKALGFSGAFIRQGMGSVLKHTRLSDASSESACTTWLNAQLDRDSKYFFTSVAIRGAMNRHQSDVFLNAEGAEAHLKGLSLCDGKDVLDHQINVQHHASNTVSRQLFKGILSGQSRNVFNGRVFIDKGLHAADSDQLSQNLVLSRLAEVDTKPQLEVHSNDVKAKHGASIGRLNEEQLFYLQTRAIPRAEALVMLADGFVNESLSDVEGSELKPKVKLHVQSALKDINLGGALGI